MAAETFVFFNRKFNRQVNKGVDINNEGIGEGAPAGESIVTIGFTGNAIGITIRLTYT